MSGANGVPVENAVRGDRLPRGRHGIPPEQIVANQRERMIKATAELIAERGYASLLVSDVVGRAGVSRATFYKLYDDKHDCVLTAQQFAYHYLHELLVDACASGRDWPQGVAAAVEAALDFAATHPGEARLVLASSYAPSEPRLAGGDLATHRQLFALLDDGARGYPGAKVPEGIVAQAAVGAAMSIVGTTLADGELAALLELKTDLVQISSSRRIWGPKRRTASPRA